MLKNRMKALLNLSTLLALCISLLGSALSVTPARAASIVVNSNGDTVANDGFCSLREAITSANGDTASGTMASECAAGYIITLVGSQLPAVTSTMTITGNGEANTIIQANAEAKTATYRVVQVSNSDNLTLENLTVRNGACVGACAAPTQTGGGIQNQGKLTVSNVPRKP